MYTKIILSVVVALFVISLVLVAAINIENNQTLSERTEFEIYQDYIDSQKRTDSTKSCCNSMKLYDRHDAPHISLLEGQPK